VTLQMVRFRAADHATPQIDRAIAELIDALERERPEGVRYAATRLADGVTYLLLLELADGVDNPLPSIPEAVAFQQLMRETASEPIAPEPLTVAGSYRLLGRD
jgi:hypothetical protein